MSISGETRWIRAGKKCWGLLGSLQHVLWVPRRSDVALSMRNRPRVPRPFLLTSWLRGLCRRTSWWAQEERRYLAGQAARRRIMRRCCALCASQDSWLESPSVGLTVGGRLGYRRFFCRGLILGHRIGHFAAPLSPSGPLLLENPTPTSLRIPPPGVPGPSDAPWLEERLDDGPVHVRRAQRGQDATVLSLAGEESGQAKLQASERWVPEVYFRVVESPDPTLAGV